jgi:hypothetical protein
VKRATITLPDDLEAGLDAYLLQQEAAPAFTTVMQSALREYLDRRGFGPRSKRLRVTPAKGSGARDVSLHHDRYLAGK